MTLTEISFFHWNYLRLVSLLLDEIQVQFLIYARHSGNPLPSSLSWRPWLFGWYYSWLAWFYYYKFMTFSWKLVWCFCWRRCLVPCFTLSDCQTKNWFFGWLVNYLLVWLYMTVYIRVKTVLKHVYRHGLSFYFIWLYLRLTIATHSILLWVWLHSIGPLCACLYCFLYAMHGYLIFVPGFIC